MRSDIPPSNTVENLFLQAYPELVEAGHRVVPALSADGVDTLLRAVARLLGRYDGPCEVAAFKSWALTIINPGAQLLQALNTLKGEHVEVVRRAIRSVLAGCSDLGADNGTVSEIESTTWVRILMGLDRWLTQPYSDTPGCAPAQLATRLYSYARLQAMGWRTGRLRYRAKHISQDVLEKSNRKPSESYPIVLGPGDIDPFTPEPKITVDPWEHPIDSEVLGRDSQQINKLRMVA